MLAGRRCVFAVLAAAALVLGSGAASAEIVKVTIEGTATPFTQEIDVTGHIDTQEGTPFDVTLEVYINFSSITITPGLPDELEAHGTILSWTVIGDTWSETYDASSWIWGYDTQDNYIDLGATYYEDPTLGIVPLSFAAYSAVLGGNEVYSILSGVGARMTAQLDPTTGDIVVEAAMAESVVDQFGVTGTGYNFAGTVTGYSVCGDVVPEPASLGLLALGVAAIAARKAHKRNRA